MLSTLLIGIILILNTQCLFENIKYIKSFTDVNKLQDKLNMQGKISLILIYSDGCPHCKRFEPEFIRLSETYNNYFDFYIIPAGKSNYKSKFKIRGVPTMFFYDGNNFIEHKGHNNYDTISYILENDYSKKCKEIDLENLINLNNELSEKNEKTDENYILGYFPNEDFISNRNKEGYYDIQKLIIKTSFENFINNTNQMISRMDNCYYIRNLNTNINNEDENMNLIDGLSEGTIIIFSGNKGINIFAEYQNLFLSNEIDDKDYYEKRIRAIGDSYKKFLGEKVIDYYIDITDSKMVNKLTMYTKKSILLFVYKNDVEKTEYKRKINIITSFTKNEKYPLFDFVLFKYGCSLFSLSYNIRDSGIYYIDKDFTKISGKIDLNVIINMIKTQNEYEYNPEELSKVKEENAQVNNTMNNNTNITNNKNANTVKEKENEETFYGKIRDDIIEKQLINYLNRKNEEALLNPRKMVSVYCFILCLIIYSLTFDFIYKRLFPGKSIFDIFKGCINFIKVSFCDFEDEDEDKSNILTINP